MLEAHGLAFAYGSVPVLFRVDLRVDAGEIVALVGTNGAGKSTLLDLLAGLARPTAGTIVVAGEDVTGVDAVGMVRRGVVLVQGGRATFPDLSVVDNLLVGLPAKRLGQTEVRRRAADLLERFPALGERAGQRAGTLSGGEQQLLAIAKGLVHEPRVLLVDEVTLGLAPAAKDEVVSIVREVHTAGATVVFVDQDIDVATSLAARAVFLEEGSIVFDGPSTELRRRDDLVRAVFLGVTRA